MGREIRRVPTDWEHPKNERGHYQPLYNQSFDDAFKAWMDDKDGGTSPDPEYYRPAWAEDAELGYCMYETVSEGTPVSPVFESLQGLEDWMVEQGTARENAKAFCKSGWVPSFIMGPQIGIISGLDAAAEMFDDNPPKDTPE